MPALGPIEYSFDGWPGASPNASFLLNPVAGARGLMVAIGNTTDVTGTMDIGGVSLSLVRSQAKYSRFGALYYAPDITGRTDDYLDIAAMSGTSFIGALCVAAADSVGLRASAGDNSWSVFNGRTYTHDDGIAGAQYQLGVFCPIGEYATNYEAAYAAAGGSWREEMPESGGGGDTGMGMFVAAQGPGTATLTYGVTGSGSGRFSLGALFSFTDLYVPPVVARRHQALVIS